MTDWSDSRITNQKSYLKGAKLVQRAYRRYSKNPDWDHDHCAFCWAKFMAQDCSDVLRKGYATVDDYHWVCERCFDDFKDLFEWKVINETDV